MAEEKAQYLALILGISPASILIMVGAPTTLSFAFAKGVAIESSWQRNYALGVIRAGRRVLRPTLLPTITRINAEDLGCLRGTLPRGDSSLM